MSFNNERYTPEMVKSCRAIGSLGLLIAITKLEGVCYTRLIDKLDDDMSNFDQCKSIALETIDTVISREVWAGHFTEKEAFDCYADGAAIAMYKLSQMKYIDRQAEFAATCISSDELLENKARRWVEEFDGSCF